MNGLSEARSLDRALAGARMPQVPAGLAARIAGEVTGLPQQSPGEVSAAPVATRASNPRWMRAAVAAALALVVGVTTLVLRGGAETEHGEQLAAAQTIAPPATPSTELAVAPVRPTVPAAAKAKSQKPAPAVDSYNAPASSAAEPTELAVAPALAPEPVPVVAQQDAVRPATTVVEPLPASTPIYGPSAPPQGLGIAGGSGANMSRSGPGGGAAPGGLGGPPRR